MESLQFSLSLVSSLSTWRLIATGPATGDLLLVEVTPVAGHVTSILTSDWSRQHQ